LSFDAAASPTLEQGAIIILLLAMMVVFALNRFRIELVALCGLAAAVAMGLVPVGRAFEGFANPAVITVAEILLIIQALGRSRVVERLSATLTGLVQGEVSALALLCALSGFLSVFMNNVGALALMLPVSIALCAKLGLPLRRTLMPVSFATLLGGLCSLIGTPANLVVSQTKAAILGQPFAFFDLAYVGVPVAVVGIAFLVGWVPGRARLRTREAAREQGIRQRKLVTEVKVLPGSPLAGQSVSATETALGAQVFTAVREGKHLFGRPSDQIVEPGDLLVVQIATTALEEARESGAVALEQGAAGSTGEVSTANVVLMPQSIFVGSRIGTLEPLFSRGVVVAGVVPQRPRVEGRLADIQLAIGDILVLSGPEDAINEVLDEVDLLRLSSRGPDQPREGSLTALAVFSLGVLAAAFGVVPPEIAFGAVVLMLAVTRSLHFREGIQNLNWPILIMLAAMIPLGSAVETTGAARSLSLGLLAIVPSDEPVALVGCVLLVAVMLTPFVNNVSAAVVLSPIAIEVARAAGLPAEAFLVAVALGASLDFLTPFGHHNNTLVMGIAGYRFSDFSRLGLPLLAVTAVVSLLGIWAFWL
jgi:di/tricarboxylate transporter